VPWRWDIEPKNVVVRLLRPVLRPILAWSLQRDMNAWTKAAADRLP
jgi:hypothetical protein